MLSRMWQSFKQHFSKAEVLSLVDSFVTGFALDSYAELHRVLEGDVSRAAILGLAFAVARSAWKMIRKMILAAAIKGETPSQPATNADSK